MLNQTKFTAAEIQKAFPGIVLNHHAWPKRQSDRQILLLCIAAFFDFGKTDYREVDVNDQIMSWNAHFGHKLNLDHVTLRRELVDARILQRSDDGKRYAIIDDSCLCANVKVIRALDLEALISEEKSRRQRNRERYKNTSVMTRLTTE